MCWRFCFGFEMLSTKNIHCHHFNFLDTEQMHLIALAPKHSAYPCITLMFQDPEVFSMTNQSMASHPVPQSTVSWISNSSCHVILFIPITQTHTLMKASALKKVCIIIWSSPTSLIKSPFFHQTRSSLLRSSNLHSSTVSSHKNSLLISWSSSHAACLVPTDPDKIPVLDTVSRYFVSLLVFDLALIHLQCFDVF